MNAWLTIPDRKAYARRALIFLVLMLVLRWWSGRYLTFIGAQPLKGPDLDWSYWLVLLSGLPQLITGHLWACKLVDGLIVFFTFAAFFFPGDRRLFIALLAMLLLSHFTVETYSVIHTKTSVVLYLALLPLCVKEEHFGLMAEMLRYFVIFIFISAAWYKFHNGALMDPEHFSTVLARQHADLALFRPGHVSLVISQWLQAFPFAAWLCFIGVFLLQAAFGIGLFTKDFDRVLAGAMLLFAGLTYLVMRISLWEMLVGSLVFLTDLSRFKPVSAGNKQRN